MVKEIIFDEIDRKIDELHQDLQELLEWQAGHALNVADSLCSIQSRISELEKNCVECKEEVVHVLSSG